MTWRIHSRATATLSADSPLAQVMSQKESVPKKIFSEKKAFIPQALKLRQVELISS